MEETSKLRILAGSLLIAGALSFLPFLLSAIWINPVQAKGTASASSSISLDESPNVITRGAGAAADQFKKTTNSVSRAVDSGFHSTVRGIGSATKSVASAGAASGKFVAHGIDVGVTALASGVGSGFNFTIHTTGSAIGMVGRAPGVSYIIKPADKAQVPVIDPRTPAVTAAQSTSSAKKIGSSAQKVANSKATWPIHGEITTEFGVPHWPFQPIHTGIDISDGALSGITAIHPFRAGVVTASIHSYVGFGNHVIIDHGNGLVSLYGHLASIAVRVGQKVNLDTVLGREGSTGASTGTHLHFEIQLNGHSIDPRKYVSGQP